MQARYELRLSPVRGTAFFLALLAALVLAAAAGFLYRGASVTAPSQSAPSIAVQARGLQHDDSWAADARTVAPHDDSYAADDSAAQRVAALESCLTDPSTFRGSTGCDK